MKLKELLQHWQAHDSERRSAREFAVRLPVHDAARIMALVEMFPGRDEAAIVTDLLSTSLDELEAVFPYIQGERVITRDEFGDSIYEDAGPKQRFNLLTSAFVRMLEAELKEQDAAVET